LSAVIDRTLTADDGALAEFRYQIRQFLHFSEKAARSAGLNPQHHQLLLALKGIPKGLLPSINEIARRLHLRHHSVVELTNLLTAGILGQRSHKGSAKTLINGTWTS